MARPSGRFQNPWVASHARRDSAHTEIVISAGVYKSTPAPFTKRRMRHPKRLKALPSHSREGCATRLFNVSRNLIQLTNAIIAQHVKQGSTLLRFSSSSGGAL
jgi:hypothetical protein